jgi:DNA-binding GntR family transcriptional regulator
MRPMINRDGKVPIYQQIANELRHGIRTGRYPGGTRLPSETELMELHHVARLTARKARNVLAEEGLVEIVQGRGAFVIDAAA